MGFIDGMREVKKAFKSKDSKRPPSDRERPQSQHDRQQFQGGGQIQRVSSRDVGRPETQLENEHPGRSRASVGADENGGERALALRSSQAISSSPTQHFYGRQWQPPSQQEPGVLLFDGDYNSDESEEVVQPVEPTTDQQYEALHQKHSKDIESLRVKHEAELRELREDLRQKYSTDLAREKDKVGKLWQEKFHDSCEVLRGNHAADTKRLEEGHEKAFQDVKKSYQEWHDSTTIRIQRDHAAQLAQSERKHERECQDLRSEFNGKEYALKQKHDTEMNHLKGQHQTTCQSLNNELENERTAVVNLREQHKVNLRELGAQHKEQYNKLSLAHQQQLDDARLRFEEEKYRLTATHDDQRQAAADEHSKALLALEKTHKAALEKCQQEIRALGHNLKQAKFDLQKQMRDAQRQADEMDTAHRADMKATKDKMKETHQNTLSQHKKAIALLDAKHVEASSYAQTQIEELNTALIARDDELYHAKIFVLSTLPQLPDEKIKKCIDEVETLIDDLSSRHAWDPARELWPDHTLQKLCGQHEIRILRKSIVRDLIWCLLFKYVFAHPFRIFGNEGEKLQELWLDFAGQDATAQNDTVVRPTPSLKTERWRYMTLEECYLILTQPVPAFMVQREKIKTAYYHNMTAFAGAIETTLTKVMQPSTDLTETANRLAKRTSKLWLDFGRHRCRIVVRQVGGGPTMIQERISTMLSGSFKLTVSPIIGRFGNNKGTDLEDFKPVTGSTGNTYEIGKGQTTI